MIPEFEREEWSGVGAEEETTLGFVLVATFEVALKGHS